MPNFESIQVYGGGPYSNPPDHPHERREEETGFLCPYCIKIVVDDEGEMCAECRMAEAERMAEQ